MEKRKSYEQFKKDFPKLFRKEFDANSKEYIREHTRNFLGSEKKRRANYSGLLFSNEFALHNTSKGISNFITIRHEFVRELIKEYEIIVTQEYSGSEENIILGMQDIYSIRISDSCCYVDCIVIQFLILPQGAHRDTYNIECPIKLFEQYFINNVLYIIKNFGCGLEFSYDEFGLIERSDTEKAIESLKPKLSDEDNLYLTINFPEIFK